MRKFIVAAAFVAAQWQPAHAQMILGSIPEEFRGDWCWQEKTNGKDIFRPGAYQPKRYANLQQVFLALRRFDTLGRDVPPGRLVLRWQMLLD
jgi:hypothetical protein